MRVGSRKKNHCPACDRPLGRERDLLLCPQCGARHHRLCWHQNGGCGDRDCRCQALPVEEAVLAEGSADWLDAARRQMLRYALLFVTVATVTALIAFQIMLRGQEMLIPDLTGLNADEARQLLDGQGLRLKVSDKQYDATIPENCLISQSPPAGSRVKKGRLVRATLSLGSKIIQAPELAGQDLRMARQILRQSGLSEGPCCRISSADQPANIVISQDPPAAAQITKGGAVSLLVSQGRTTEYYLMPDLIYQALGDRLSDFIGGPCQLDRIDDEIQDDLPAFTIIRQSPPPGSRIASGAGFTVVLSRRSEDAALAHYRLLKLQLPTGPGSKRLKIELLDRAGPQVVMDRDFPSGTFLKLPILVSGRGQTKIYINGRMMAEREI